MMCLDEKSDQSDPGDCTLKHGKGGTVENWEGGLLGASGATWKLPEPHENSADDLLSWGTKLSVLNSDPHKITSKKKHFFQLLLLALSCV